MDPRLLHTADLPALLRLSGAASWNQTEDDWLRVLRLEPQGCFGIEIDGQLTASAIVITYPPDIAWIGMVLTSPEFRGRGLARALMIHGIQYCGSRVIRLDASDMGKPLYDSLGFISECPIERWLRGPAEANPDIPEPGPQPGLNASLDLEITGADRGALLRELARYESATLPTGSFALARPGAVAAYFGPCQASSKEDAATLRNWFLSNHAAEPVFWDLFPHHESAVALAKEAGFHPVRQLTRMVLNGSPALPDPRIYGIAGFEYG